MITIRPFITMVPAWLRHTVFFALGLIAQASLLSAAQVEDGIIAIVNSDLIMLSEMKRELAPERERIQKEYRGDILARRLKTAEYMALTSMIERKLQLQEAKVRGIAVTDQEVRQAVQQMKQQGQTIDETNPADMKNVREQLMLLRQRMQRQLEQFQKEEPSKETAQQVESLQRRQARLDELIDQVGMQRYCSRSGLYRYTDFEQAQAAANAAAWQGGGGGYSGSAYNPGANQRVYGGRYTPPEGRLFGGFFW